MGGADNLAKRPYCFIRKRREPILMESEFIGDYRQIRINDKLRELAHTLFV
jgi:hypothetical protein